MIFKTSLRSSVNMFALVSSVIILTNLSVRATAACEKINRLYIDPEVILDKKSRTAGYRIIDARAVKSRDFREFYFVQYKISDPQGQIIFPMFAMNKPLSSSFGVIYSMDNLAKNISGYGDGRRTKAKFSSTDHGYAEASSCLK